MHLPRATYRLQLRPSFGFKKLNEQLPYLGKLGISDIYASPVFKARLNSEHGYDIVDQNALNPQLGTSGDWQNLFKTLKKNHLCWIQDIVPNHMAYNSENQLLVDLFENGPASKYFDFLDIDWEHPYSALHGKLLAPFLGKPYGQTLEAGELVLRYQRQGLSINYYDLSFPLAIDSYTTFFTHQLDSLKDRLGSNHPDYIRLLGTLYVLKTLSNLKNSDERYNQITFIKRTLFELYQGNADFKGFVKENLKTYNGQRGQQGSFLLLEELLNNQYFHLAFWKVAKEEINYRRFFNINELISLRVDNKTVCLETHRLINKFIKEGLFKGVRVDHVDGLSNPLKYLTCLRQEAKDCYIIVEKILADKEDLPDDWPVQGTTGYDFLNHVNGIFCQTSNKRKFNRIYRARGGVNKDFNPLVKEKKKLIIDEHMAGDVDNLARLAKEIAGRSRHGADVTLYALRRAIKEILASFPVYRSYLNNRDFSADDRNYIERAVFEARYQQPGLVNEFNLLHSFLLLNYPAHLNEEEKQLWLEFSSRFQQFTAPLMAKGFEDTTLYIYNRLLSLNEVGGNPENFGISPEDFHKFNKKRKNLFAHSLNATATHDTKRGEDTRARINVLSEIPLEWERYLKSFMKLNKGKKKRVNGELVPDSNDEYFLYQTLLAAAPFDENNYPLFLERIKEYIVKAVREAKIHTAWLKPDSEYEEAYIFFVESIFREEQGNIFLEQFKQLFDKVAFYGIFNSLSQLLLKVTAPGVPDFYQGTELWDFSLVDPDNRREVDFKQRQSYLEEIVKDSLKNALDLCAKLLAQPENGKIKLFLTYKALQARKENRSLFENGDYYPLPARGKRAKNVFAFARREKGSWAITIVPRLLTTVVDDKQLPITEKIWNETYIDLPKDFPQRFGSAITGEALEAKESIDLGLALKHFPVALLISHG